ncbi:hypothetical protein DPMN_136337 [Dreissena polymorpha]|uniref:Uncharacterized protein n=1 Tax=Dreissena polymorpha TaxID=45954 RepID=A0A9D4G2K5_DREPO|nr:hypothetical protein DPMN_136337 [Dreissena polymorpha]
MATLRQEIEQNTRAINSKPPPPSTMSHTEEPINANVAERNISCSKYKPFESDHAQATKKTQTYADILKTITAQSTYNTHDCF